MLLVGSHALNHWFPGSRVARDVDYICTIDEYNAWIRKNKGTLKGFWPTSEKNMVAFAKDGSIYEFEIAWPDSTAENILKGEVADPNTLLLLKTSHRYRKNSPHFHKTRNDILFLRSKGAKITDRKLLKLREKETYTNLSPKLNQNKEGFFTDSIQYTYDHDTIHEAVKLEEVPAYTRFKDGEVWCSKKLWDKQTELHQLHAVVEESMVLAIERSLVPFPGGKTPFEAFTFALEKVCTSITSGWFREFAWENYDKAIALYDRTYYNRFLEALRNGKVKLHES